MSIDSRPRPPIDLLRRIRGEYLEMPGMRLTALQAQRLFGLSAATCDLVLGALLDTGFLTRAPNGMFTMTDVVGHAAHAR